MESHATRTIQARIVMMLVVVPRMRVARKTISGYARSVSR